MTDTIAVSNTPRRVMMTPSTNAGNRNKIEEAERELAELLAEQRGDHKVKAEPAEEPEGTEVTEAEPAKLDKEAQKPVETGWEKRYKDAQRYINKLKEENKALEEKVKTATVKPPKSKAEIEAWMNKFPDVAAIVEAIAAEKAETMYGPMSEQMERFEEMRIEGIIARTEAAILKAHPDYLEIKDDGAFHTWAEDLPTALQNVLYETIDDPRGVIKIINMYKLENNITNDGNNDDRSAAQSVKVRAAKSEAKANRGSYDFLESDIERMSMEEYQKNFDKIQEARQKNRIKMDVSGR